MMAMMFGRVSVETAGSTGATCCAIRWTFCAERVLRRFDRHKLGVAQKNSKSAVFGVGAGLVPDIGADTEGFQRVGLQNRIGAGNDGTQIGSPCPQTVLGRTKTPAFHPAAQRRKSSASKIREMPI